MFGVGFLVCAEVKAASLHSWFVYLSLWLLTEKITAVNSSLFKKMSCCLLLLLAGEGGSLCVLWLVYGQRTTLRSWFSASTLFEKVYCVSVVLCVLAGPGASSQFSHFPPPISQGVLGGYSPRT